VGDKFLSTAWLCNSRTLKHRRDGLTRDGDGGDCVGSPQFDRLVPEANPGKRMVLTGNGAVAVAISDTNTTLPTSRPIRFPPGGKLGQCGQFSLMYTSANGSGNGHSSCQCGRTNCGLADRGGTSRNEPEKRQITSWLFSCRVPRPPAGLRLEAAGEAA
jgi:hypothetical protein